MKSPFTGGKVVRKTKYETYTFRGEKYRVMRCYFQCVDTGKTFSNAEVDDKVMEALYSQYRKRHNIPSPSQLRELRERYGFSAHLMSRIAGIGINQYGIYEKGEMPTIVVGHKLASLFDKESLLKSVESSRERLGKDYGRVKQKLESYPEPFSLAIETEYYSDFDEIHPFVSPSVVMPIKRSQWSYCNI